MTTVHDEMTVNQEKTYDNPGANHMEMDLKPRDEVILKSSLDDLGLWTTVKRFWKVGHQSPEVLTIIY